MNYLKENNVGIDNPIKRLQVYLYDRIVSNFGLSDFDGYGRVYRNRKDNLFIPEAYVNNKEYKEVLLDDRNDGIMFFSPESNSTAYGSLVIQKCDLIFSVNLDNLYGSNERKDEEFRQYVLSLLNLYVVDLGDKEIETDLNKVYEKYNGVASYFYDMQNFHHFKIKINLKFNNNTCI